MIALHGIWTFDSLHVFGEHPAQGDRVDRVSSAPDGPAPWHPFALANDELRDVVGELTDSLLVSEAAAGQLTLRLPTRDGRPLPSEAVSTPAEHAPDTIVLQPWRLASLVFPPPDALELLTTLPAFMHHDPHAGASLRYWSRSARLVLDLLAKRQFVPDVHRGADNEHRGLWRVVTSDEHTSLSVANLVASMPPVCRAFVVSTSQAPEATELIESFLWRTVDGIVRRCLEGDELAWSIQQRERESPSPETRWLASLVRSDSLIKGTPEDRQQIRELVAGWISRLEVDQRRHRCRTCFCLHAPDPATIDRPSGEARDWRLTFHVQSVDNPNLVLDAEDVYDSPARGPVILGRPFDNIAEQLREDLARAAVHFPPLEECIEKDRPVGCYLTLSMAHRFLREAASLLELEGFGVWTPTWWASDHPHLGLQMHLGPAPDAVDASCTGLGLKSLVDFNWTLACGDEELEPDELAALAESKVPLLHLRGRWTEVNPEAVEQALRFLHDHRQGRTTVFDALRRANMPDVIDTGLPVLSVQATGWVERLLDGSDFNIEFKNVEHPPSLHGTLRPYQLAGLAWLDFLDRHTMGACLADDMGLGKTVQMIAMLLRERCDGAPPGPTLVIVPMSVVGNWQRETQRFAPSLKVLVHHGLERLSGRAFVEEVAKYDMVVSTYGLVHRDFDHLNAVEWHRVVLDEAQNIKNPAAKQSKAVRALRTRRRVALTGTPIENRLSELWSIMEFLNPSYMGSAGEFRRRFAVPIERHRDSELAKCLRRLINPFVLRRTKDDPKVISDLPEKMEMNVYCNLTHEQAALYEALTRDMLNHIEYAGGIQRRGLILSTIVKLKQICNHPTHFLRDESPLPHRSGKCDRLTEMLEEVIAEQDHALVFTQFRKMGDLLQRLLQESLDREVLFLHGGTSNRQRTRLVDRFQTGSHQTPIFVLSLKAGGVGLNLTAANHVFHFDRWWNPAVEQQATDRAHRIGQERQLQVHKFVCIGTMEERIDAMLEAKKDLADKIIGTGEDWLTELSTEKLRTLFALSREAVTD